NVKAAIEKFDDIVNIPCASHTLQLSITYGLKTIEATIKQCKELIAHLSGNKKRQELQEAQKATGVQNPVDVIKPIDIRWNSMYFALERLVLLERPIRWLENTLSNGVRYESRKEGTKLQEFLPRSSTFETLSKLIPLLKPFEKTTRLLGGENYCTLSLVTPAIEILIQNLKNSTSNDDDDNIVQTMRKSLLENLEERWHVPSDYGLYASFLDPRFKALSFISLAKRHTIHNDIKYQFNKLKDSIADSCEENNLDSTQLSQLQQSQSLMAELFSEPIVQQQDTNT
ncbi:8898_t:CDS:2, partial [Gigaspora rosea]